MHIDLTNEGPVYKPKRTLEAHFASVGATIRGNTFPEDYEIRTIVKRRPSRPETRGRPRTK
jgi:hypothetical protein